MANNNTGKGIYRGYHQAGADFLGYRLAKLFVRIETPEDTILHNDVLKEVLQIIYGEEKSFFRSLAEKILYKPPKMEQQKRFLFEIACIVLNIGQKKG